jgi:hypothetical protein
MFAGAGLAAKARAIVAQAAYTMVRDPYATARAKDKSVMTLVRMLQSFERTRSRPDGRSSSAPLAQADGRELLDRVPLGVLLASVPRASDVSRAVTSAGPH